MTTREPTPQDRLAIVGLMRAYAAATDRADWDAVRECYHPDAYDDHGVVKGSRDDLVRHFSKALDVFDSTLHLVGEPEIVAIDDVTFEVRTPSLAFHWAKKVAPVKHLLMGALYHDIVENRGGTYAVARRTVVLHDTFEYEGEAREWGLAKFFAKRGSIEP